MPSVTPSRQMFCLHWWCANKMANNFALVTHSETRYAFVFAPYRALCVVIFDFDVSQMSELVSMCIHPLSSVSCSVARSDYLNTFEFLDRLAENLKTKLSSQPKLWFAAQCLGQFTTDRQTHAHKHRHLYKYWDKPRQEDPRRSADCESTSVYRADGTLRHPPWSDGFVISSP